MHFKNTLLIAALSAGAAADFIVITEYPQALQTLSPEQSEQWISSNLPALQNEFLQIATDTSYLAQATSVIPELRNFVATASVSIPPVVTAVDQFTIYTTVPSWYSELPSGVKSFYDDAADRVESFLNARVPENATASASGTGNVTTPVITPSGSTPITPSGEAPPENTGAAGKVQLGLGAGVAAGLVGLLAL
ncbi:hypothetical protein HBH70_114710 [Parastagonospora nodorum]|nr:hypothetical protein HBH53_022200 [Parastagonospora nodorum]KAH3977166.1 hypothetical protein HBH52_116340 [Parastagonospora nodorum]KAH3999842.1 hypothetical protein HBI10_105370 [Parastagonospora nodorum]KAH4010044.1 hypothetical protein HBI13_213300 [Parastagonospora nodorum]KAH4017742.1 hypothetical protein HBI09_193800 [Parastagonospora nodorum]